MLAGRASQTHSMPGAKPLLNPDRKPVQPWGTACASKLAFTCQEVKQLLDECVPILFTYLANIVFPSPSADANYIWVSKDQLMIGPKFNKDTSIFLKDIYLRKLPLDAKQNNIFQLIFTVQQSNPWWCNQFWTESTSVPLVLSPQLSQRNWSTLSSFAFNIRNVKTVCSFVGSHKLCSRW